VNGPADLQAILGGSRQPRELDREERVKLIGAAAQALLAGRLPDDAARLFLAGALSAWLERGGDLERDFFRVRQRGSHHTPAVLWRLIGDEYKSKAQR